MTLCGIIGGTELIIVLIFALFVLLLPLVALVDILKSKFEDDTKIIWVIVVIFLSTIGAILYFLIGKNQKIKDSMQNWAGKTCNIKPTGARILCVLWFISTWKTTCFAGGNVILACLYLLTYIEWRISINTRLNEFDRAGIMI